MTESLKIALIHPNIRYKDVAANARQLLALNRQAARNGHQIIVNTEMGLSGYSFPCAEEIRPHALNRSSEPVKELASLAREFRVFICTGMALEDVDTGILTNAALVFGPMGKPVCTYHKITAEARWACPGDPCQNNVFSTPWGRVGILICSDSYHGLLVRQTALKGADLILVPANWPPSGLDPRELWSIRARENGIYLAACNRTGTDRIMDCTTASSGLIDPEGQTIVCRTHPDSIIISAQIPLQNGKLPSLRNQVLARRTPRRYPPIYLDMRYSANNAKVLTDWHDLNPPGPIAVTAFTAPAGNPGTTFPCGMVERELALHLQGIEETDTPVFSLLVFPEVGEESDAIEHLLDRLGQTLSREAAAPALTLSRIAEDGEPEIIFMTPGQPPVRHRRDGTGTGPGPEGLTIVDTGPARIGICLPEDLCQPEIGIAHAKLGCDLLVSSMGTVPKGDRLVMAGRCIDRLGVAGAAADWAFVCAPPRGHARFEETLVHRENPVPGITPKIEPATRRKGRDTAPKKAAMTLDTTLLREKIFQDRVDYHTLLAGFRPANEGKLT